MILFNIIWFHRFGKVNFSQYFLPAHMKKILRILYYVQRIVLSIFRRPVYPVEDSDVGVEFSIYTKLISITNYFSTYDSRSGAP